MNALLSTICINIVRSTGLGSVLCKPNLDLVQMSAARFTILKWHPVILGMNLAMLHHL